MNLMKNKISKDRGDSVKRVKINNQLQTITNSFDMNSSINNSPATLKDEKT